MPTRRKMILTVTGVVAIAGCAQTTETETERPPGESGGVSPDQRTVSVENKRSQPVEIEIIVNASGKRVHSETYNLDQGEQKLVYNSSSDNLGSAGLEVTARTDSNNITRRNSGCSRETPVSIEPDGTLTIPIAVC